MSRYGIITDDENLEIFVGFDEGFEGFFLTVADIRESDAESESYLFHNMEHHPGTKMFLRDVETILEKFGLRLPADLASRLTADAKSFGIAVDVDGAKRSWSLPNSTEAEADESSQTQEARIRVLDWSAIEEADRYHAASSKRG